VLKSRSRRLRVAVGLAVVAGLCLVVGADARTWSTSPTPSVSGNLTMLALTTQQTGIQAVVSAFESAYPSVNVNVSYVPGTNQLLPLMATQLAAGNGPDILDVIPGDGTPVSVVPLAHSGYLLPLVNQPWVKRTIPSVTSLDKVGPTLYAFSPGVQFYGMMVNYTLFAQHHWAVPRTFPQLLQVCKDASAAGVAPFMLAGGSSSTSVTFELQLAASVVFGSDPKWTSERKQGKVTWAGSQPWTQALGEVAQMNSAGCFAPGSVGNTTTSEYAQFASGGDLMFSTNTGITATIAALNPTFSYGVVPFPNASTVTGERTNLNYAFSLAVNAKTQNKAAAEAFIDFVARPAQAEAWANDNGELTQTDYIHHIFPKALEPFAGVFKRNALEPVPVSTWWNPTVLSAFETDAIGLVTGQTSIQQLEADLDKAWSAGPD
jgi:raffinose/stachyose/melibiose transport system substrate-binding protein